MQKKIKSEINTLSRASKNLLNSSAATHGLRRALRRLLKEILLFENHIAGVATLKNNPKKEDRGLKVQIGGGEKYLEGFLNIDIIPPADIIFDVREGIPLRSGSVKFLFTEHFLEHIDYPLSVKKFVKECYRTMERGGRLVIGVPDAEVAANVYVKKDKKMMREFIKRWYGKRNCLSHFNTVIDFLNYHFRDQDDDKKYAPHLWAYDYEKLKSLLVDAGFHTAARWNFDEKIANPKRKFGSIYITVVK